MKSKQQKRAEAALRLERRNASAHEYLQRCEPGSQGHTHTTAAIAVRQEHIAYLHSIADRKGGRVKRRQVRA